MVRVFEGLAEIVHRVRNQRFAPTKIYQIDFSLLSIHFKVVAEKLCRTEKSVQNSVHDEIGFPLLVLLLYFAIPLMFCTMLKRNKRLTHVVITSKIYIKKKKIQNHIEIKDNYSFVEQI